MFARCLALEGLSRSEVVSIAWDPHPREPVEGVLWAMSVLELAAELADSGAEGKMRPVSPSSHYLALHWFRSRVGRLEVGARMASRGSGWCVLLLAASGGGLVAVVVTTFPHDSLLGCQSVVALACVASRPRSVSGVRGGSACGPSTLWRSEVVMLVVCSFPIWFVCVLQVDCSCCYVACVASVVARCVHAMVAQLAMDSLAVVFPMWRTVAGKSRRSVLGSLRHLSVVVVGLVLADCELWCIAWLPCVLGLRYAVDLAGAFWWVFPELCLGGSGGGPSQDHPLSFRAECAVWLGCVLVRFSQDGSWRFWWRFSPKLLRVVFVLVSLFVSKFLDCAGGTSCIPVVRVVCFISRTQYALADGGLGLGRFGQLCPFRLATLCVWLLEGLCFVSFGALVHYVVPWVASGACDSAMCCVVCLFVALSVVRQALVVACVQVFPLALGASMFGCDTLLRCCHEEVMVRLSGFSHLRFMCSARVCLCDCEEEGRARVPSIVELAWSKEEPVGGPEMEHPMGLLSRCPFPSRWYRDSQGGHDSIRVVSGVFVAPVGMSACAPGGSTWFLLCLPRLFARCLALEGLSHSEVVSIAWDPHPREHVEGVLWAMSVLELAAELADSGAEGKTRPVSPSSHYLALRWFWNRVGRSGMGPQLVQAAVVRAFF
ncbi:hypothetical protein Taro_014514 [Colocasia esculenta]|uniref:Uncharacterized protein n=1 Tax=Colocasia esculenta TaxID=4460 RepID=A0A843UIZ7_COLES|nr:hypothetical protein [Colocasia esculenta]